MEHVEEAGVHSGDSACAIPPQTLPDWVVEVIEAYTTAIANRLDVRGLINVQYAVAGTTVYVIEANPRASRTVPFVAKAKGVPLAKVATRVMLGATLAELRAEGLLRRAGRRGHVAVKEAVLPFNRFPEVDPALGPEMRSTGEVMGIDATFGRAFFKAELAAGNALPHGGHGVPVAERHTTSRPGWSSPAACASAASGWSPRRERPSTSPASACRSTRCSARCRTPTAARPRST